MYNSKDKSGSPVVGGFDMPIKAAPFPEQNEKSNHNRLREKGLISSRDYDPAEHKNDIKVSG